MPFEITILSGKGGTGKTSVTAAFAQLAAADVICDLDVDASNLPLLMQPELRERHTFVSGEVASLDRNRCRDCGRCLSFCKFGAIYEDDGEIHLNPAACEGCGVCARFCRPGAITMHPRTCGEWYVSDTQAGTMLHARLNPGEENSGRLISTLRQDARQRVSDQKNALILSDGPPGIGCPVISSVTGTQCVICVTEPTASGLHDLQRVVGVAGHFKVPVAVILNKDGLHDDLSREIENFAEQNGLPVLGRIPYSDAVMPAIVDGATLLDVPEIAVPLRGAWNALCRWQGIEKENEDEKL
jgi:MinD superfamily P-loop ATPase